MMADIEIEPGKVYRADRQRFLVTRIENDTVFYRYADTDLTAASEFRIDHWKAAERWDAEQTPTPDFDVGPEIRFWVKELAATLTAGGGISRHESEAALLGLSAAIVGRAGKDS